MITLKMISEKISAWLRDREAVRELSHFSDHELCDIGIRRSDIEDIVRRPGPRGPTREGDGVPMRREHASSFNRRATVFDRSRVSAGSRFDSAQVLGPGETSRPGAKSKRLSDNTALP
jgi:uncharacterized protein YjiS (DUF1127 family)